jgi:hypothetical protein
MFRSLGLALALCFALDSSCAQAGVIEGSDPLIATFVDTSSGLEWMDFGVNNDASRSVSSLVDNLPAIYPEWRLPTFREVIDLFVGTFEPFSEGNTFDFDYDGGSTGGLFRYTVTDFATVGSAFNPIFAVMGFDKQGSFSKEATAYFFNDIGTLSAVSYADRDPVAQGIDSSFDEITAYVGQNETVFNLSNIDEYSLLLVRSEKVPAPETLGLISLGLLGLRMRRS